MVTSVQFDMQSRCITLLVSKLCSMLHAWHCCFVYNSSSLRSLLLRYLPLTHSFISVLGELDK